VATLITLAFSKPKHEIVIREAKYVPADLMNYTLPYVVAFMSIDYQDMEKFSGLVIFLAWMFWITYRSGQIALNPVLIVFGWRLYEIKYQFTGDTQDLMARGLALAPLTAGDRVAQSAIQDILIIKNDRTPES
jgi:hypothetical protein